MRMQLRDQGKTMKVALSALFLLLGTSLAIADTVSDEEQVNAALQTGGSGKFMISGIVQTCPYIGKIMSKADPADRILFMTDATASFVRHASCEGACDLLAMNNVMAVCQSETGAICAPFAGITGGTLYDMSFDPTGASLADCGL